MADTVVERGEEGCIALDRGYRRLAGEAERERADAREQVGDRPGLADMGEDGIGHGLLGRGRGLQESAGGREKRPGAGGDLGPARVDEFLARARDEVARKVTAPVA